ncbi:MAG: hypothetical protein ACYC4R_03445 [Anaerolineae bacterium]
MSVLWRVGLLAAILGLLLWSGAAPVAAAGTGSEVVTFRWEDGHGVGDGEYAIGFRQWLEVREVRHSGNTITMRSHETYQYTVTNLTTGEVLARTINERDCHYVWNQTTGALRVEKVKGADSVTLLSEVNPYGLEPLEARHSTCIVNGEPRLEHIWLNGEVVR